MNIKASCLNVGGLRAKLASVEYSFRVEALDLLCLTETWLPENYSLQGSCVRFDVPGYVSDRARLGGGVSLLANPQLGLTVRSAFTDRQSSILVCSSSVLSVICVYVSPSCPKGYLEAKLTEALSTCASTPCILLGDFNARLGALAGDVITTPRGKELKSWSVANAFRRVPITAMTFESANGGRSAVDHIYIRRLQVSGAYGLLNMNIVTDGHKPIFAEVSLPYAPSEAILRPVWRRKFLRSPQGQLLAAARLRASRKRLHIIVDSLRETASLAGYCPQGVMDIAYRDICDTLFSALAPFRVLRGSANSRGAPPPPSTISYQAYQASLLARMNASTASFPTGSPLSDTSVFDTYSTLYERRGDDSRVPYFGCATRFSSFCTERKLRAYLKRVASGKSPGPDHLISEIFSIDPKTCSLWLFKLFSVCWENAVVPSAWNAARVVLVHKKGKPTDNCDSYRPIACTSHIRKIFEKMLLQELQKHFSPSPLQAGFRQGHSTLDQVLTYHTLCERYPQLSAAFLDIRKAYDTVDLPVLWEELALWVDQPFVRVLQALFSTNLLHITNGGRTVCSVECHRGLLQGAPLSPWLYTVFLHHCLEHFAPSRDTLYVGDTPVPLLLFADDMVVLGKSVAEVQRILRLLESHAHNGRYEFSPTKSVLLSTEGEVKLQGVTLPCDTSYVYLGIPVSLQGIQLDLLLERNFRSAMRAATMLQALGVSKQRVPLRWLSNLIKVLVRSRLEYGLPLARFTRGFASRLDSLLAQLVRTALDWPRHAYVQSTLKELGMQSYHVRLQQLITNNLLRLRRLAARESIGGRCLREYSGHQRESLIRDLAATPLYLHVSANHAWWNEGQDPVALLSDGFWSQVRARRQLVADDGVSPPAMHWLHSFPNRLSRLLLRWRGGLFTNMRPCRLCEEPLSALHALRCAGASVRLARLVPIDQNEHRMVNELLRKLQRSTDHQWRLEACLVLYRLLADIERRVTYGRRTRPNIEEAFFIDDGQPFSSQE